MHSAATSSSSRCAELLREDEEERMTDTENAANSDALRSEAERLLQERPNVAAPAVERLQHELSVHQIELELQNETLRDAVLQLEQARDRLLDLYDYAPTGYVTLDEGGVIKEANLRMAQLLGVDRARLIGRSLVLFTVPEGRTQVLLMLRQAARSDETVIAELTLARPDGRSVPVRLECLSREVGVIRVSLVDITAERTARDALITLNEALEERVKARTRQIQELGEEFEQVTLGVTEDLSLALRRVTSFVEVIRRDSPSMTQTQQTHLNHVFLSVERIEAVTAAMLAYTRISRMPLRTVAVNLNRVLTEVLKDLQPQLSRHTVRLGAVPLPRVMGDTRACQIILHHLLDNAVKFSAEGEVPVITVSAEETETEVVLRVEDNGVGFNNRHQDRLFKVFKRLHPESAYAGIGMDLAIVQRLCLRSGSRVWGHGRVGEGATFWLAFPKHPDGRSTRTSG